jgi:hypothetical protein
MCLAAKKLSTTVVEEAESTTRSDGFSPAIKLEDSARDNLRVVDRSISLLLTVKVPCHSSRLLASSSPEVFDRN